MSPMGERQPLKYPPSWALPEELLAQVGEFANRQRALAHEGQLLVILHHPPEQEKTFRRSLILRRERDGRWSAVEESNPGVEADPEIVMCELLNAYRARLDVLDDAINEESTADGLYAVVQALIPLRRALRNLDLTLADAVQRVPPKRPLIVWREQAHIVAREAELLYEEAEAAIAFHSANETVQSRASQEAMERAAHRLNLVVALFLPLTAIASVFGMNLASGLETASKSLFWTFLAVGLALGAIMAVLLTRPLKKR